MLNEDNHFQQSLVSLKMAYMLLMYASQAMRFRNTNAQVLLSSRKAVWCRGPESRFWSHPALSSNSLSTTSLLCDLGQIT